MNLHDIFKSNNKNIVHLTDLDLSIESRNKNFEQISLKDFNLNLKDANNAYVIFFVDSRDEKSLFKKFFTIYPYKLQKIKQLK
ncbi:MAG: hypothetical protein A2X12_09420 [Bacteroidetes bacterium GWE2_29_8]|nr:MAG: hypothetical protein A2X12_09420 [Bacteroidetes bacterium GWE2_29_8]OFY17989.1 MAG: hypothetical protein A2X02_04955 [Bacteroidetes bacterium GWF2_29_10]